MKLRPLRTEEDYEKALQRLEKVFDAPLGSVENDEAEILVTLVEKYESTKYPIEAPDPIEAIKIRMQEMDLTQKDLMTLIGAKSRGTISNLLKKRRPLTLPMIRVLGLKLGIPFEVLVQEY